MDNPLREVAVTGYVFKEGDWIGPIDPAEDECATCDERRRGCSFCCGREQPRSRWARLLQLLRR